ncbi:MAG: hypothetical protein ACP5N7_04600 [Candidatus Pacearchaeota archaeon]
MKRITTDINTKWSMLYKSYKRAILGAYTRGLKKGKESFNRT